MVKAKINFDGWSRIADIGTQDVYDVLTNQGVDDFDAIDADSWCEIATVGEIYERETFSIEIIDE